MKGPLNLGDGTNRKLKGSCNQYKTKIGGLFLHRKSTTCTKSIISILIGIAIDKGFISSVDVTMEHYFPDIVNHQADPRKKDITIEQLLTMSVGLDWPEFGEWNYMPPMFTNDVVKFVFDRELVNDPGKRMNYNSGCSHILSEQYLFKPLGINGDYRWFEDANLQDGIWKGKRIVSAE